MRTITCVALAALTLTACDSRRPTPVDIDWGCAFGGGCAVEPPRTRAATVTRITGLVTVDGEPVEEYDVQITLFARGLDLTTVFSREDGTYELTYTQQAGQLWVVDYCEDFEVQFYLARLPRDRSPKLPWGGDCTGYTDREGGVFEVVFDYDFESSG